MRPVPIWFKYASYLIAGLFLFSAALQYNDPDPIRWMLIYGGAAGVALLLPAKRPLAALGGLLGLGAAAWSLYLIYSTWGQVGLSDLTSKMSEKGGAVEVGREAGGLAIVAVWLLFASAFRRTRA